MKEEKEKVALVVGRFQPFHIEHEKIFDRIRAEGFEKVIVLLGEQRSPEKDPFHYSDRANFFKEFLPSKGFKNFYIAPMWDTPENDHVWASEVYLSVRYILGSKFDENKNIHVFIPRKSVDEDENGYHYGDSLKAYFQKVHFMLPSNEGISGTAIRENPHENLWMVHPFMTLLVDLNLGAGKREERIAVKGNWICIIESINLKDESSFFYSKRKNSDSIAFVLRYGDYYGFIIEGKPPIKLKRQISAFGGGFDEEHSHTYKILRNEVLEEAGFGVKEIDQIHFKGAYLSSTQSDEVAHLFLVDVNSDEFNPTTEDPSEQGNTPIWIHKSQIDIINDWKVQMILKDEK